MSSVNDQALRLAAARLRAEADQLERSRDYDGRLALYKQHQVAGFRELAKKIEGEFTATAT